MAEKPEKSEKTIEMRLAEIEDKLNQLHITEEEMKTFQKVATALGMGSAPAAGSAIPQQSIINRGITPIRGPIIRWNCICICECTCGPCACNQSGGGSFGGGFGGFGM